MADTPSNSSHKRVFKLNDPVVLLANFVELISQIWKTKSVSGLQFLAVNRSYEQVQYDQALWLDIDKRKKSKLAAVSNVAIIERNSSFVAWIEKMANEALALEKTAKIARLTYKDFSAKIGQSWQENDWVHALWVPLYYPEGELRGVLLFSRAKPSFQERDIALMQRLSEAYAQHYVLLTGGGKQKDSLMPTTRNTIIGLLLFGLLSLFIPVRESSLAPMEIRPKNPHLVSSPLNAAIDEIYLEPNVHVSKGQKLLKFNDTEIKSDYQHADKVLEVTKERLRTTTQDSFQDEKSKMELRLIKAQLKKDVVVRDFKKKLYEYIELTAPTDGLLLYSGKNEWVGKPVTIGERLMFIADEGQVEIEAQLAVSDDLELQPGAELKIFLNANPLEAIPATLRNIDFTATKSAADIVSFKVIADLAPGVKIPRIGSKGTAKIYGRKVPLGLFLFKKPISALRQMSGL